MSDDVLRSPGAAHNADEIAGEIDERRLERGYRLLLLDFFGRSFGDYAEVRQVFLPKNRSPGGEGLRDLGKSVILSAGVETRISAAGNRLAPEAC